MRDESERLENLSQSRPRGTSVAEALEKMAAAFASDRARPAVALIYTCFTEEPGAKEQVDLECADTAEKIEAKEADTVVKIEPAVVDGADHVDLETQALKREEVVEREDVEMAIEGAPASAIVSGDSTVKPANA